MAAEIVLGLSSRATELSRRITDAKLHQLHALIAMLQRVVSGLARSQNAAPQPQVTLAPNWAGWPDDVEVSSVPLVLTFPGPGAVTDVSIRASWVGADAAATDVTLDVDGSIGSACYAVKLASPLEQTTYLNVEVRYSWGPLVGLCAAFEIAVSKCVFSDYLTAHAIEEREFPDPFVVDRPLDRSQVQTELFQGREHQLAEVRSSYTASSFPPLPLCFYGIRKTGKTSLLRRVANEIECSGLVPLEVNLLGQRADTLDMEQLCLGLLHKIRTSALRSGADPAALIVPDEHPNPTLLVPGFFASLAEQFNGSRIVVLLDEYQGMQWKRGDGTRPGEPVLDSLRPVHEEGNVGFIAFSNQGLDPSYQTASQFALRGSRVDFLQQEEVARAISTPLHKLGVQAHPSAIARIFDEAAGHPNFSVKLAKAALEQLNADHRNIMTINDITQAAEQVLANPGAFKQSWFSRDNLSVSEIDAAEALAKSDPWYEGHPLEDTDGLGMSSEIAKDLEAKLVVEVIGNDPSRLRIRGRLLWRYLRQQLTLGAAPRPSTHVAERVGVYVDLENIRPHVGGMSYRDLAEHIKRYAASLGDVATRWVAIASWSTGDDWHRVQAELKDADFLVKQEPQSMRPARRDNKRDAADFVLAGQVLDEVAELDLSRVVIATGDGDFMVLVTQLLEKDVMVRLIGGSEASTSKSWIGLAERGRMAALAEGLPASESDFDYVLLENVVSTSARSHTRGDGSA